jgi:endonuclease/exonuclease/phosphatase family metal-dependent hydrolase
MSVRVVSYNLLVDHYASTAKPALASVPEDTRRPLLVDRIAKLDPDIVCLQEVENFDKLASLMHQKGYWGVFTRRNNGELEGCATFYKNRRFEIPTLTDATYFNDGTGRFLSRMVLQYKEHKLPPITVYNSHVDWGKCSRTELSSIASIADQSTGSAVICGDFNVTPNETSLQTIRERGFRDSLAARPDQYSFDYWNGKTHYPNRIDYIFGRNLDLRSAWTDGSAYKLPTTEEPSDHLPVCTDYTFPSSTPTAHSHLQQILDAFSSGDVLTARRLFQEGLETDAPSHKREAMTKISGALYALIKDKLTKEQDYFGCAADIFLGKGPLPFDEFICKQAIALARLSISMNPEEFEARLPSEIKQTIKWAIWALEGMPEEFDFSGRLIHSNPNARSIGRALELITTNGRNIFTSQVRKDLDRLMSAQEPGSLSSALQASAPLTLEILSAILQREGSPSLVLDASLKSRVEREGREKGIVPAILRMHQKITR